MQNTTLTRHSAHYLQRLLVLLLVLLVPACGFQLRGTLDISEDISPLYIQKNSAFELARELTPLLSTNNIVIAENRDLANTQLVLLAENKKRRILSVDGSGRAREYLLIYSVNFSLKIKQQKEVQEQVSLTRSLLFDPDAVLAVDNESEILYKDMRRNAARLILLKLQAHSKQQSANSSEGKVKPQ